MKKLLLIALLVPTMCLAQIKVKKPVTVIRVAPTEWVETVKIAHTTTSTNDNRGGVVGGVGSWFLGGGLFTIAASTLVGHEITKTTETTTTYTYEKQTIHGW